MANANIPNPLLPPLHPPQYLLLFERLLSRLAQHNEGFIIGVDTHLRIHNLLNALADKPTTTYQLKYLLSPILATNPAQQIRFYQIFDEELQSYNLHVSSNAPAAPQNNNLNYNRSNNSKQQDANKHWFERISRLIPNWAAILSGFGIAALFIAVLFFAWWLFFKNTSENPNENPLNLTKGSTANKTTLEPPPNTVQKLFHIEGINTDDFVQHNELADLDNNTFHRLKKYFPYLKWLILSGLLIWFIRREFNHFKNRKLLINIKPHTRHLPTEGQAANHTKSTTAQPIQYPPAVLQNSWPSFFTLAQKMRLRQQHPSNQFAIEQSIAATITHIGYPQLRYKLGSRQTEYLILIAQQPNTNNNHNNDHLHHWFGLWLQQLNAKQVFFETFTFNYQNPLFCQYGQSASNNNKPSQYYYQTNTIALAELCYRYPHHHILVLANASLLFNEPVSTIVQWAELLANWPQAAILSPIWTQQALQTAAKWQLPALPVHPNALAWPHLPVPKAILTPSNQAYILNQQPNAESLEQLKQQFPPFVFDVLCALAILPQLNWQYFRPLVNLISTHHDNNDNIEIKKSDEAAIWQSLLPLVSLPWLQQGNIPEIWRLALAPQLPVELSQLVRANLILWLAPNKNKTDEAEGAPNSTTHFFNHNWLITSAAGKNPDAAATNNETNHENSNSPSSSPSSSAAYHTSFYSNKKANNNTWALLQFRYLTPWWSVKNKRINWPWQQLAHWYRQYFPQWWQRVSLRTGLFLVVLAFIWQGFSWIEDGPAKIAADLAKAEQLYLNNQFDKSLAYMYHHRESPFFTSYANYLCADILLNGYGKLPADTTSALPFLLKAAQANNPEAAYLLGTWLADGIHFQEDHVQADALFAIAFSGLSEKVGTSAIAAKLLTEMYLRGRYGYVDQEAALQTLQIAVSKNYAQAQYLLGRLYYDGYAVNPSETEALNWFTKAAQLGYPPAMQALGTYLGMGIAGKKSNEEAIYWLVAALKAGDEGAANALSNFMQQHLAQNANNNEAQITALFAQIANAGFAPAQNKMGFAYEKGIGVDANLKTAFDWYLKAAEQGYLPAQMNLGYFYSHGLGITQNYTEAFKWYNQAAAAGNAEAQNNLAYLYDMGLGVAKNDQLALNWYMQAATQHNAVAQYNLGHLYLRGKGAAYNAKESFTWYKKAAEAGYAPAFTEIGYAYEYGIGVEPQFDEAINWYKKAKTANQPRAAALLDSLTEKVNQVRQDETPN
ncbi:MAG: sel1 repeat family protein [Sphingobacteriales bacterium]|nr:sel1 repeat family protein [Sphingobacteriales bacterium]